MASSKTEICNLAIRHIGGSREIDDFDTDRTKEAAACRRFYPQALSQTYRDFKWPHAVRIVALAELTSNDWDDEWPYAFRYPSVASRVWRIVSGTRSEGANEKIKFRVVGDDSGRVILTDESEPSIEYSVEDDVVEHYPADFVGCVAWRLASMLAPSVTKGLMSAQECLQMYAMEAQRAGVNAANEEQPDEPPLSEFERMR